MSSADYLVIGGGLIGMLTARELALAGNRVRLVERGSVGRESSWAGGGILSPLHPWRYPDEVTALAAWSQPRYPVLAKELHEQSGIDPQWVRSGLLMLDTSQREEALAWAGRHGYPMELLADEAVRRCEPALGASAAEALFMPEVAQVRNPRLLQAMRGSLQVLGVTLSEGHEVTGLKIFGERVHGVSTNMGEFEAGTVIVAGGAWTARLLAGTGIDMQVRPVRGQMLLFDAEPGVVSRIVLDGDRYVIPRRDGKVLVGSTVEETGFLKETTEEAFETLKAAALALIPRLGDYPVAHHWAGLRPGSPRGVPYVGPHPELRGLYVNAGHFRNGVVLGLASARLLADLVLGREPALDPAPYALGRAEP